MSVGLGATVLVIGILAALCFAIFSIPGLIRIIKTKDTASVSLVMYIIFASGAFLFVLMSIMAMAGYKEAWIIGITLGNLASLGMALTIIVLKANNMKAAKHNGMTEKQWCDKLYKEAQERKNVSKPSSNASTPPNNSK